MTKRTQSTAPKGAARAAAPAMQAAPAADTAGDTPAEEGGDAAEPAPAASTGSQGEAASLDTPAAPAGEAASPAPALDAGEGSLSLDAGDAGVISLADDDQDELDDVELPVIVVPIEAELSASDPDFDPLPVIDDRTISVRSVSKTGRRRAGLAFTPTPTRLAVADLSTDQLAALVSDPEIIVQLDD